MNAHSLARTTPMGRALLVQRVLREGRSVSQTAAALGISARTAHKWLARYRLEGAAGLRDRSSRPHDSPTRTDAARQQMILALRRSRQSGPQIARSLRMPKATVARVLRRAGLQKLRYLDPPEPPNRYERKHPGKLLHLDVKKLARIVGRVGHRIHGDRSGAFHLYVRDLSASTTLLVNCDTNGAGAAVTPATFPRLAADGRAVIFESPAANLVADDRNRCNDVFARDLIAGSTELISAHHSALASATPNGLSTLSPASPSSDGRFLTFSSEADNLAPNDTNRCRDVFVRDLATGNLRW